MTKQFVVERKLRGIKKDGTVIEITVAIGIPYEDKKFDAWACPLIMEGLYEKLSDQHGIDSWQAFRLSQKLAVSLLRGFMEKGGKLYLFGDSDEVTTDEIEEFF